MGPLRGLVVEGGPDQFGQGGNVYSLGGVHNEEWTNPESRNLATPKFRVSAGRIQMPRVSVATVVALLSEGDVDATADSTKGSRQLAGQGKGVWIPSAVDDRTGASLCGSQRCDDGGYSKFARLLHRCWCTQLIHEVSLEVILGHTVDAEFGGKGLRQRRLTRTGPSTDQHESLHGLHSARDAPSAAIRISRVGRAFR